MNFVISRLAYRLRILAEMLVVDPWRRLPLTVQWLNSVRLIAVARAKNSPISILLTSENQSIHAWDNIFSKNKFNELIFSAQRLSVCLSYPREILSRLVLFSLFSKCLLFPQEYQTEFPAHLQPPAHMAILNGAVRTRKVTSPGTPVGEDGRVMKTFPETSAGDIAIVAEVTHAGINCFVCGKGVEVGQKKKGEED